MLIELVVWVVLLACLLGVLAAEAGVPYVEFLRSMEWTLTAINVALFVAFRLAGGWLFRQRPS